MCAGGSRPNATQAERLTEQFYRWEHRGRGWQLWDSAVGVEPAFEPFRLREEPSSSHVDDGQRPTFLSSLTEQLARRLSGRSAEALVQEPDLEEPEPDEDLASDDIVEVRVAMPPSTDVSLEAVEQLLVSIPRPSRALSFELIGTASEISIQLTCATSDRPGVQLQLGAHFPDSVLTVQGDYLQGIWSKGKGTSVVVELGLSEEFMLPLRVLKRLTVDPLAGVAATVADLDEEEAGVLQVLFQPVRHPWAQSITQAVLDDSGSPFFLDAPEITALAKEKVSRPLFACVIRVAGRSPSPGRAILIARSLSWALNPLANPPINRLIPVSNDGYPDDIHEQDLLERRTHRSGMILSSAELASLVHPPSASVRIEKLIRETAKTRGAPGIAAGHPLTLGTNQHGGRSTEVSLSADQRSRHLYAIGASGTGKSTMLLNLILQDLRSGQGLAVLDPHGDLVDEILQRMPPERLDDVVLIDPADAEFPIGFNVLSAHSELERTLLASDLVAVFRRLSTSWGDQMTSVLGNAILAILESDRGGTLVDLRRFLVEAEFRREYMKSVGDPEIVYYWQKEFPLLAGKPQAPLLTRLDIFLRPKPIRFMVAQQESRLDLRRLMDEGKVFLARLSQGAIGEENAYLLGTLLVSKLHQLAISRQEVAAADRRPFYLYIDEFQNFVTPSMEQILSGARKYRLGLILAHQDLRQIQSRSADVMNSVLSNPYARVCFRVGDQDARTLADGFAHFDARDLQSLSTGQAIMRLERSEFDFNLTTPMLPPIESELGQRTRTEIVEQSRRRFGRPRAEVEELLRSLNPRAAVEFSPVEISTPATDTQRREPAAVPPAAATTASEPKLSVEHPTVAPSPGRGGKQHKYLQSLISRWGDANGWRATIEEQILGGLGNVDVALRKGGRSIACEIGITTAPEHEIQNIQKCLAAGFEWVFVVSVEKKTLNQVKAAAESLEPSALGRVKFCVPDELFDLLDVLERESTPEEQSVRGYRVKVKYGTTKNRGNSQGGGRAVSAIIARALRQVRRGLPR